MKFAVFAKHLQTWSLTACCQQVKSAGFDGLDLTVRPGGYIEPANIKRDLAGAIKLIRSHGLEVPLFTTALLRADEPGAAETVAAAPEFGVREIKLGYWNWNGEVPIRSAIDNVRRDVDSLEKLARAAGVRINIHNHCGDMVQNTPFAVAEILRDRDPKVVGAYFDAAHYTIEGGLAGWKVALDLLTPKIALLAIKDHKWVDIAGIKMPSQERRWVPVGSGQVHWKHVLPAIRASGYDGWASIHGEYQGRWTFKEMTAPEVLAQCVADREVARSVWDNI